MLDMPDMPDMPDMSSRHVVLKSTVQYNRKGTRWTEE